MFNLLITILKFIWAVTMPHVKNRITKIKRQASFQCKDTKSNKHMFCSQVVGSSVPQTCGFSCELMMPRRGQSDYIPVSKFVSTICLCSVLALPHHLCCEIHCLMQEWHTAQVVISFIQKHNANHNIFGTKGFLMSEWTTSGLCSLQSKGGCSSGAIS